MTTRPIKETRLHNARLLQAEAGSQKAVCEKLGKSQSRVSAFMGDNPSKGIGDAIAREFEVAFDLPNGWMDSWHDAIYRSPADQLNESLLTRESPGVYRDDSQRRREIIRSARRGAIDIDCLAECIENIELALEYPDEEPVTPSQKAKMIAGLYVTRTANGSKTEGGDVDTAIAVVLAGGV